MNTKRAVAPVISVILMVGIVVILVATASVFFLGNGAVINDPAPNVADTTGKFTVAPPGETAGEYQTVRITHLGGDNVAVENMEIIVRASGPGDDLPSEARLVDLPSDGYYTRSIDDTDIRGEETLISESFETAQIIVVEDTNTWSAGDTIEFRVSTEGADFRGEKNREGPEADELEVIIVHTPSNTIVSEHAFTA